MSNSMICGHKTLEDSKNSLVKDLKAAVGDAEQLLNQLVNSTTEELTSAHNNPNLEFN